MIRRNVGWLIGDRVFRLVVGLGVNVWMVRYLGADTLGLLSFSQSVVAVLAILSQLGLETIVVRDLVRRPDEADSILGTALGMRLAGAALTLALSLAAMTALRPGESGPRLLALIFAGATFFQSLDVIEYWFQSRSLVAPFVAARATAFVAISIAKVVALLSGASLQTLALLIAGEFACAALALLIGYRLHGVSPASWRFEPKRALGLLRDSWPLILNSVAILVSMRADQTILTTLRGDHENGIYAAAQRLTEIIYFVPVAMMAAANPTLLRSYQRDGDEYGRRLGRVFTLLLWSAILIASGVSALSGWIVTLLFGSDFRAAGPVLAIQVWSAPALFLGVAQTNWFVARGRQRALMLRSVVGAVTSLIANLWLVPPLGARGAAIAMVISQTAAHVLTNLAFPSTRALFRLQWRAVVPTPIR